MEIYDLAILGAGPGGYVAALRAGQLGLKTVLIEKRDRLGGTCLNVGCIPTKALLESSEHYHRTKEKFSQHGIMVESIKLDLTRMLERKDLVVTKLTTGIAGLMKRKKVKVIHGEGLVRSEGKIYVGEEEIRAKNILLAMGSVTVELPHLPRDGDAIVNSDDALSFDEVPQSLVVVGGGAVGLELASVWSRLGANVTVVEMMDQLVPFADSRIAKGLERSLKKQGMEIKTSSKVTGVRIDSTVGKGERVRVTIEDKKGRKAEKLCEKLLVSVGRKPNTEGQGLAELGVELDDRGRIVVDDSLQTSVDGVYALGDLTTGPMLAHKAEEEGVFVAEYIAGGKSEPLDHRLIPNVVYTWPEMAQVGIGEDEAKADGVDYVSGTFYFGANGRALAMGESEGMVKILSEKETDRLLGVHILGPMASELIAAATVAMASGMKTLELGRLVHAHPTLSEAVKECALAVHRSAIHG